MAKYETMLVTSAALDEEASTALVGKFKSLIEEYGKKAMPQWIEREPESFEAKIVALPAREDIDYEVSENLIVELYSR